MAKKIQIYRLTNDIHMHYVIHMWQWLGKKYIKKQNHYECTLLLKMNRSLRHGLASIQGHNPQRGVGGDI